VAQTELSTGAIISVTPVSYTVTAICRLAVSMRERQSFGEVRSQSLQRRCHQSYSV